MLFKLVVGHKSLSRKSIELVLYVMGFSPNYQRSILRSFIIAFVGWILVFPARLKTYDCRLTTKIYAQPTTQMGHAVSGKDLFAEIPR